MKNQTPMLPIKHYPIKWWVEKLKGKPFSLARFGDGEFLCIQGRRGANSHGCKYTPELKQDLTDLLKAPFMLGMQRILSSQRREIRPMLEGDWVDTEIFADSLKEGKLKPFLDFLRTQRVVIISSAEKADLKLFPCSYHIVTPRTNTHAEKDRIVKEILNYGQPAYYLYACGMAAGTIIHAVHGKISKSFHIDIGHILDPFTGELSREYLKEVLQVTLDKNL